MDLQKLMKLDMTGREFLALDLESIVKFIEKPKKRIELNGFGLTGIQKERKGRKIEKRLPKFKLQAFPTTDMTSLSEYQAIIRSAERKCIIYFKIRDIGLKVKPYVIEIHDDPGGIYTAPEE